MTNDEDDGVKPIMAMMMAMVVMANWRIIAWRPLV